MCFTFGSGLSKMCTQLDTNLRDTRVTTLVVRQNFEIHVEIVFSYCLCPQSALLKPTNCGSGVWREPSLKLLQKKSLDNVSRTHARRNLSTEFSVIKSLLTWKRCVFTR